MRFVRCRKRKIFCVECEVYSLNVSLNTLKAFELLSGIFLCFIAYITGAFRLEMEGFDNLPWLSQTRFYVLSMAKTVRGSTIKYFFKQKLDKQK